MTPLQTTFSVQSIQVPRLLYGTAWKEERTKALTISALAAGFRVIDTANQRKHYNETAVGDALAEAMRVIPKISRERLYLQTKFTFETGQDQRLPYDRRAPVPVQVEQSFESSLAHL